MTGTDLHRSLPAAMIDLIRDGCSKRAMSGRSGQAIYGALVSTAMSAMQRGHTYAEWAFVVSQRASVLGTQAHQDHRGRDIGDKRYERKLRKAWAAAETRVSEDPAWTAADVRSLLVPVVDGLDSLSDDDWPLGKQDRAVLRWALSEGARIGCSRVPLPRHAVATHLRTVLPDWDGLEEVLAERRSQSVARRSLERLAREDWLRLEERGLPTAPNSKGAQRAQAGTQPRRAALYALPLDRLRARLIPEPGVGPVGQTPQACGPDDVNALGRSARPVGQTKPTNRNHNTEEDSTVITIRLRDGRITSVMIPDGPDAREEVLGLLRASGADVPALDADDRQTVEPAENVVPLRNGTTGGPR